MNSPEKLMEVRRLNLQKTKSMKLKTL